LTADHLGSPRITTDANGVVTARHDYQPFGEEIQRASYGADAIRQQFTSYERDIESSLDFAQARYYNSGHGRFTSVDPIMMEKRRLADPQAINLYVYTRNNPLKYVDPDGEKFKGTDGDEVIIEREKVNGKKIWVIKSGNASDDLKKLVGLINNSGSRTANNMFGKLNKHETMINLVIDSTTSRTQEEISTGSTTIGLHQPHDKNGPLTFNSSDKFDGKAEPAAEDKGAYKEATITLFEKKMEELGYSGERLDGKLVSTFGHEASHDLDPIQIRAGLTGTGSNDIWHPEKNGNPKKKSPDYFEQKIERQIERKKGIKIN
jgi:RHS repeat-associated protein